MEFIVFNVSNQESFNLFFSIPLNLAIPVAFGVAILSLVKNIRF